MARHDISTIKGFSNVIGNYHATFSRFLKPYNITPEDFIETCIRAVKEQPKLLQCDPKSLFGAVLLSAEIGLKPNTPLQHSFILPYGQEAKFQIGYKGLIEIMYRNSRVKQITARAVYKNDFFEYNYGLKPDLIHKPARAERGSLDCVYATCLIDDYPVFTVVEKAELLQIKSFSKTAQGDKSAFSPYNNGTDIHNWMEIKAAIKSLSKLIPTSNNNIMAKAVEYDSKFEGGAKVLVDIPESPHMIVEPKLIDENNSSSYGFENAFDTVITTVEETTKINSFDSAFDNAIENKENLSSKNLTPLDALNQIIKKNPINNLVPNLTNENRETVEQLFNEPIKQDLNVSKEQVKKDFNNHENQNFNENKEHSTLFKEHSNNENEIVNSESFDFPSGEDDEFGGDSLNFEFPLGDDDEINDDAVGFDFPSGEEND